MLVTSILVIIYFIPTIIVWNKDNPNAVITLNLLVGWTGIGWLISLIWAINKK
jgi:hypothetical protein